MKKEMMISQFAVGGYDDNFSYVVWDHQTMHCAIVDPAGNLSALYDAVDSFGYSVVYVLITHTHRDHIEGIPEVVARYSDVQVVAHSNARGRIAHEEIMFVDEGDQIQIGTLPLDVLHTPGHISDAVCYIITTDHATDGIAKVLTGDTLFVEGCGLTTREDASDLYASLMRLKDLPDTTEVYVGHDYGSRPVSTIAWEKAHNRFLFASDFEKFLVERFS